MMRGFHKGWCRGGATDFVVYRPKASVLCPAYIIARDPILHSFVLAIRGTHTTRDIFTSLSGAAKPHHYVDHTWVGIGVFPFWYVGWSSVDLQALQRCPSGCT